MQSEYAAIFTGTVRGEIEQKKSETFESLRRVAEPGTGQNPFLRHLLKTGSLV